VENEIVPDKTISQAAEAGLQMTQAAFKFSERQAQADADEAVMKFKSGNTDAFYGAQDAEGNLTKGYDSTAGKTALDSAGVYNAGIDGRYKDLMEGLSPSARAKASLRMGTWRNTALNKGAQHQAAQMKVHEENLRYASRQLVTKEIKVEGSDVLYDGTFDQHIETYPTQEGRDEATNELAKFLVSEAFSQQLAKEPLNPNGAQAVAEATFEEVKGRMTPEDQSALRGILAKQGAQAAKTAKTNYSKNLKFFQKETSLRAVNENKASINSKNYDFVLGNVAEVRNIYTDQEFPDSDVSNLEESTAVVSMITDSITGAVGENKALITVENKMAAAEVMLTELMTDTRYSDGTPVLSDPEKSFISIGIKEKFKADLITKQNKQDSLSTFDLTTAIEEANGRPLPPMQPPAGMLPDNEDNFRKVQMQYNLDVEEGMSNEAAKEREGFATFYRGRAIEGKLSFQDVQDAWIKVGEGKMGVNEYRALKKEELKTHSPTYKPHKYRTAPGFIAGREYLSTSMKNGQLMRHSKYDEKDNPEEYAAENAFRHANMIESMEAEAFKTAKNGGTFNGALWAAQEYKDIYKQDSIVDLGWGNTVLKTVLGSLKSAKTTIIGDRSSEMGDLDTRANEMEAEQKQKAEEFKDRGLVTKAGNLNRPKTEVLDRAEQRKADAKKRRAKEAKSGDKD